MPTTRPLLHMGIFYECKSNDNMSLVKSISGIRGTIGGRVGEGLNPVDIVRFTAAYATQRRAALPDNKVIVVVVTPA